jgi:hypothetical protein
VDSVNGPVLVNTGERHPYLDANRVASRIWMGGYPRPPRNLARLGFSMLVLCAEEAQPDAGQYPGTLVVRAPNDDARERPLTPAQERIARNAAREAADHWRGGGRVLVTCYMGWNRSGLVTGLLLRELTDLSPAQIVQAVRNARGPSALSNASFVAALLRSPAGREKAPIPPLQVVPR